MQWGIFMLPSRSITPDDIRRAKLLLRDLEEDFERLNRPRVEVSLRSSIITKIAEVKAFISTGVARLEKEARRASSKSGKNKANRTAMAA